MEPRQSTGANDFKLKKQSRRIGEVITLKAHGASFLEEIHTIL